MSIETLNTRAALPSSMQAVVTTGLGGFERLLFKEVPVPILQHGEVLLQVLAAGLNNTDINTRVGWYGTALDARPSTEGTPNEDRPTAAQPHAPIASGAAASAPVAGWNGATPFPLIQGADCCGRVVALAPDVASAAGAPALGQRVLVRACMRVAGFGAPDTRWLGTDFDGAFAQYVKVPASEVFAVDCNWSDAELATIPCAYGTAENMLQRAAVSAADHVLVTGASGGVGSAVVQLAKRRGARVSAITTRDKQDAVRALGADTVLCREDDLLLHLSGASSCSGSGDGAGSRVVDVVVDNVAGAGFATLLKALRRGGRYVSSGAIAGAQVALDMRELYLKDLTLLGCTAWSDAVFPALVGYIERNEIRPLLAGSFALHELALAQQVFMERRHVGNWVVVPVVG
ncbi:zinc-binding dehydrogenase [Rhodoferax sp.]|jgi:NADPH:quinone reductase-like Zn-dependent oxidoreductase|uniref:zinc-binding dehydrogenase n=1 Tax=Rhodoferax sp. TaxID=50421 RepID=UPI00378459AB